MDLALLQLPTWLFAVLLTLGTMAFVAGGLFLARKVFATYSIEQQDNMVASILMRQISTLLSVMLAFAVISTWQDYEMQRRNTALEASVMGNLYRDSRGLPERHEESIQQLLVVYTRAVVEDAWPKMLQRKESRDSWTKFNALYGYVIRFKPMSDAETVVFSRITEHMNDLARYRRLRHLRNAEPLIPGLLWAILFASTFLMICSGYFLRTHNLRMQAIVTTISGAIFGMIFTILLLLNHPYASSLQISAAPIENLLNDVYPAADLSQNQEAKEGHVEAAGPPESRL